MVKSIISIIKEYKGVQINKEFELIIKEYFKDYYPNYEKEDRRITSNDSFKVFGYYDKQRNCGEFIIRNITNEIIQFETTHPGNSKEVVISESDMTIKENLVNIYNNSSQTKTAIFTLNGGRILLSTKSENDEEITYYKDQDTSLEETYAKIYNYLIK